MRGVVKKKEKERTILNVCLVQMKNKKMRNSMFDHTSNQNHQMEFRDGFQLPGPSVKILLSDSYRDRFAARVPFGRLGDILPGIKQWNGGRVFHVWKLYPKSIQDS